MVNSIINYLPEETLYHALTSITDPQDVSAVMRACTAFRRIMEEIVRVRGLCLHAASRNLYEQLLKMDVKDSAFEECLASYHWTFLHPKSGMQPLFLDFKERMVDYFSDLKNEQIDKLSLPVCTQKLPNSCSDDLLIKIQTQIIGTISINELNAPKLSEKAEPMVPVQILSKRCTQNVMDLYHNRNLVFIGRFILAHLCLGKKEESTLIFDHAGKKFKLTCMQSLDPNCTKTFHRSLESNLFIISLASPEAFNPPLSDDQQKAVVRAFRQDYVKSIGEEPDVF